MKGIRQWAGRAMILLAFGLGITGCGISDQKFSQETISIKQELAKLNNSLASLIKVVILPKTNYYLLDTERDKYVGIITTDITISKGERIFLGEDMYDVQYVKIMTDYVDLSKSEKADLKQDSETSDHKYYTIKAIELLVSFAGKAKDRKEK